MSILIDYYNSIGGICDLAKIGISPLSMDTWEMRRFSHFMICKFWRLDDNKQLGQFLIFAICYCCQMVVMVDISLIWLCYVATFFSIGVYWLVMKMDSYSLCWYSSHEPDSNEMMIMMMPILCERETGLFLVDLMVYMN